MAPLPCVRRSRRCSASATKLPCRRPPIPSTTGACAQADTDIVESDLNLNPLSPCTMYHPVFQVGQRNRQGLRPSVGEAARIQSSEDAHHSITTSCLPRFD